MSTCSRCGNTVEFRYVNGRCIPLHLYGASCIGEGNSRANDYSGYKTSDKSTCFCTTCPECGDEVFFIRHNNGSVWINPPLGPPWYKHACFDEPTSSTSKSSIASSYKIKFSETESGIESNLIIGIVKSTYVDYFKTHTDLVLETGKSERIELKIKNNAGFLLGKLCVFDKESKTIWPIEEPTYIFELYESPKEARELINCPECNIKLNPKNLNKHLRRQHGRS